MLFHMDKSGTAPSDDVRGYELYFDKLYAAGLGKIKRPDLLIFKIEEKDFVDNFLNSLPNIQLAND